MKMNYIMTSLNKSEIKELFHIMKPETLCMLFSWAILFINLRLHKFSFPACDRILLKPWQFNIQVM